MAQVTWSPRALNDFVETCDFLGRRSESYATAFAKDVRAIVDSIPGQPHLGAMVPEYDQEEIRERYYQNHRIVYRIRGEDIEIIAFLNVSRRLPRTPPG